MQLTFTPQISAHLVLWEYCKALDTLTTNNPRCLERGIAHQMWSSDDRFAGDSVSSGVSVSTISFNHFGSGLIP